MYDMFCSGGGKSRRSGGARGILVLVICVFAIFCSESFSSTVGPNDVLILVNENSPTSRYIAKLYRQYHPDVLKSQVLYLSGLADCSGPNRAPEKFFRKFLTFF